VGLEPSYEPPFVAAVGRFATEKETPQRAGVTVSATASEAANARRRRRSRAAGEVALDPARKKSGRKTRRMMSVAKTMEPGSPCSPRR
jgi:hypothetical protein